jgi:predicted NUDIX family NTP pyrophosphohydrolase
MPKQSAGLLMYHFREGVIRVLVAHPGGPLFKNRDEGHWTIPKGEIDPGEGQLEAAIREFREETGFQPPNCADYLPLGSIKQKNNKVVHAWAFDADWPDDRHPQSNTFPMEWPPRSGKKIDVPEIDRVAFLPLPEARKKLRDTQHPLLDRLEEKLAPSKGE